MSAAAEAIERIGPAPRSQEVVDRIAGPRIALEQKSRRFVHRSLLILFVSFWPLVLLAPRFVSCLSGVAIPLMFIFLTVYWLGVRSTFGHAAEVVRNGVAVPSKVESIYGGAVGPGRRRSYAFTWKDLAGRERRCVLSAVEKMPPPGDEAVVLLLNSRAGILVGDWLRVV
jgi:hypothetical protein